MVGLAGTTNSAEAKRRLERLAPFKNDSTWTGNSGVRVRMRHALVALPRLHPLGPSGGRRNFSGYRSTGVELGVGWFPCLAFPFAWFCGFTCNGHQKIPARHTHNNSDSVSERQRERGRERGERAQE